MVALTPKFRALALLALSALPACQAELGDALQVRTTDQPRIKIEKVIECRFAEIGPQGCFRPVQAYPTNPDTYLGWDWEKKYTVTWSDADPQRPLEFQWETAYCGSVKKTIAKGDTEFSFTFQRLAAEFSKSECSFSIENIRRLANSASNTIRMQQPGESGSERISQTIGEFAVLDGETQRAIRAAKARSSTCPSCATPAQCNLWTVLSSYSPATMFLFVIAITAMLHISARHFRRDRGSRRARNPGFYQPKMPEPSTSPPPSVESIEAELVQVLLDMSQEALRLPTPGVDPEQDEAALEYAKQALESSEHNVQGQARSHVQISICHWAKRRFAEAAAALETAQALDPGSVWTVRDDVMLWHCKRKVEREAEKK
ncbi:hypothetical protein NLG97_g4120 [Lecanicillium saksenae]|uniref:Uncharacterized protein n=1 Tax=Lecanicillium saksenae TaxID=468837 RepID=A0ACC1QW64_9HYPO|nr:hypothetical protein NLG97_g4120 [Lecanicillium saksenae]